jgi:hypothetical protein
MILFNLTECGFWIGGLIAVFTSALRCRQARRTPRAAPTSERGKSGLRCGWVCSSVGVPSTRCRTLWKRGIVQLSRGGRSVALMIFYNFTMLRCDTIAMLRLPNSSQ